MNKTFRIVVRYVIPACIAAAGVVAALDKSDYPAHGWFPHSLVVFCLIVPIAGSLFVGLFSYRGENSHYKRLILEKHLRHVLATPLISAIDDCLGNVRGVSVHVYLVQRVRNSWEWRRPWSSLTKEERHVSIGKLGLSGLGSSGVDWTKPKGVIGQCWQKQMAVTPDLTEFNLYKDMPPHKDWKGWGGPKTFGLHPDDYKRVGGKYSTIAAVPMTDRHGKYIGCVVLNSADKLKNLQIVMPKLHNAAEIIANFLEKPAE